MMKNYDEWDKPGPLFTASFLRVSKTRLHVLLNKQEENQVRSLKEWVTREAANQDALQEAGTFR